MSAPQVVLDVVACALGELRALTAARDLPGLYSVAVEAGYPQPRVALGIGEDGPRPLLAWCKALRVEQGRCLSPSDHYPESRTTYATGGSLGGLPVRVSNSLSTEVAARLGDEWTVARLVELVSGVRHG
ncbi:MAG: hypothetical protein GEV09_15890 [Pseudonocardiaceae bacterium]|nr:hypothetical protein [Pseudonocardiaceae bacterium]